MAVIGSLHTKALPSKSRTLPKCIAQTDKGERVFVAHINTISIYSKDSPTINIDTQQRIKQLCYVRGMDALLVAWDSKIELWDSNYVAIKEFSMNFKLANAYTWSSQPFFQEENDYSSSRKEFDNFSPTSTVNPMSNSYHKSDFDADHNEDKFNDTENDNYYESRAANTSSDCISLATVVNDVTFPFEKTAANNDIVYLALVSSSQIIIFKWIDGIYSDHFKLHVLNISALVFSTENDMYLLTTTDYNDLIHINLNSLKITHHNLQPVIQASNTTFFNSNYVLNIISLKPGQLIFVKPHEIIKISTTDFKLCSRHLLTQKGLRFASPFFPFIALIYNTSIKFCSTETFEEIDTIPLNYKGHIVHFSVTFNCLSLLTSSKIIHLHKFDYSHILTNLVNMTLYDEAIYLTESLAPSYFIDPTKLNVSGKQMKFINVRKLKLLKAQNLMANNRFAKAIGIFTEYLAPPELVFSCLSSSLKQAISLNDADSYQIIDTANKNENDNKSNGNVENGQKLQKKILDEQTIEQIYQLINFMTDSRRKLLRLLESKDTNFRWHNYEISLLVYKMEDSKFSVVSNLKQLDDYLFNCYLLTNPKIINPFLRLKNHCSLQLVEEKCLKYHYYDQLIEFYLNRRENSKAIDLILKLKDYAKLVAYMKNMILKDSTNIDLVLQYMPDLLSKKPESFKVIFLNNTIDYDSVSKQKILKFLIANKMNDLYLCFLEYFVFDLHDHLSSHINALFKIYLADVDLNYDKIITLYDIGNYNVSLIYKNLTQLEQTDTVKKLLVEPLTKLGKYDEILKILIVDLDNISEAINFAFNIRKLKGDSLCKELVFKILDICLKNDDETSIVDCLLNDHRLSFLDFEEVLNKLPNEMSASRLSTFLILNLKDMNTVSKQMAIENELLKVKVINLKYTKTQKEKASAKITNSSTCPKCGKKFNKSEILCFYPNNDIVHYGCSKSR